MPPLRNNKAPMRAKYRTDWELKRDENNVPYGEWLKKGRDDFHAECKVCRTQFAIDGSGFAQVRSHANGTKHKKLCHDQIGTSQQVLPGAQSAFTYDHRDKVVRAEAIWLFKVAKDNLSMLTCEDLGQTFSAMFPDSSLAADFKCGRNKASYMMRFAILPYLKSELNRDIADSIFTIQFDETTSRQVVKQMDVAIRYWSDSAGEVVVRYLESLDFGHAPADKVTSGLMGVIEDHDLSLKNLLSLGRDGPNVNKAVARKINAKKVETGHAPLVDLGPCVLHIVHNAFRKGLDVLSEIEDLVIDIYYWFKMSAGRREDFEMTQFDCEVEKHVFMKHGTTRWLTLGPCIDRLIEQWDPLLKYFRGLNEDTARYKRIRGQIDDRTTLAKLYFLSFNTTDFKTFEAFFQRQEPLIHLLYDKMEELTQNFGAKFLDREEAKKSLFHINSQKTLSLNSIVLGKTTSAQVDKLDASKAKLLRLKFRDFYVKILEYLVKNLPSCKLLRSLRCLHPLYRNRLNNVDTKLVTDSLDHVLNVRERSRIEEEWIMYGNDNNIRDDWFSHTGDDGEVKWKRVDHYWNAVFSIKGIDGSVKYPALTRLVKAALVLPHGNADVERGLSTNNNLVTYNRTSLVMDTIVAIRYMSDAVRFHDPVFRRPEKVPIKKDLLKLLRTSRSSYEVYLEEEKRKKEESSKKRAEQETVRTAHLEAQQRIENAEGQIAALKRREKQNDEVRKVAEALMDTAQKSLQQGLKEKNLAAIQAANEMLISSRQKFDDSNSELAEIRTLLDRHENRKRKATEDIGSLLKKF